MYSRNKKVINTHGYQEAIFLTTEHLSNSPETQTLISVLRDMSISLLHPQRHCLWDTTVPSSVPPLLLDPKRAAYCKNPVLLARHLMLRDVSWNWFTQAEIVVP